MDLKHESLHLHEFCQRLAPTDIDYANLPIKEGFDWTLRLSDAPFTSMYLVVFRSVRRTTANMEILKEYDDFAYEEALKSGGLLRYFKGEMNERRQCLSFCLWETREKARAAAGGPSHRMASEVTREMYEAYDLERYYLKKIDERLIFETIVLEEAAGGAPEREGEIRI